MISRTWVVLALALCIMALCAAPVLSSSSDDDSLFVERAGGAIGVTATSNAAAAAPVSSVPSTARATQLQSKATKAAGKAKKAVKQAKVAKKAAKVAKKQAKRAKKQAKKAAKVAKKAEKSTALFGARLRKALQAVGRRAARKAKKMGLKRKQVGAFVRAQQRKFISRHRPRNAKQVTDAELRALLGEVATKQSRASISKLQAALKKKKAGSVTLPIKHHRITIHPRSPRAKKVKLHKPSPTDKNYVKHLKQTKKAWSKKISKLDAQIHALGPKGKKDWEIEYGTLDPPDAGASAALHELLTDLKPFLKTAPLVKQELLQEGRDGLVTMEALRWVVKDKLTKAKSQALLPEMYRFIE